MNYRGRTRKKELPLCRKCGMDGGIRMVTDETYERYFIKCQVCGYQTRKFSTVGAATAEWCGTNHRGTKSREGQ